MSWIITTLAKKLLIKLAKLSATMPLVMNATQMLHAGRIKISGLGLMKNDEEAMMKEMTELS